MTDVIFILAIYIAILLIGRYTERNKRTEEFTKEPGSSMIDKNDIVYHGSTDTITPEEIERILTKRYQYYVQLDLELKEVFLKRIHHFINQKTFIVKTNEGFKEMPVLVSAAAIQLTFGLNDYLLPFYKYIRIYPQEYIGDDFLKILAGNVQNNIITVAWNQFLKGNEDLTDGSNVGLHEMSHALYFQKLMIEGDYAKDFCKSYNHLLTACKEASQTEINRQKNLYSAYADTGLQEFWAESVEIFFEKPIELNRQYPSVYEAMQSLLNQDPLNKEYPVMYRKTSLSNKLIKILGTAKHENTD